MHDAIRAMIEKRIAAVDWKQAAEDAIPFIRDPRAVELWGEGLFIEAAMRIEWG